MFVKRSERYPSGKTVTLSSRLWVELQKHIDKVKSAREDGRELKLQLYADKYLICEKFHANGLWYIGIHDMSPAGNIIPFTGLNFDESEWGMLMNNVVNINTLLSTAEGKGKKRNAEGKVLNKEVLMYKWKWVLGKKKIVESAVGFFSEGDCKTDAERNTPVMGTDYNGDKVPNLVCEKFWGPPPDKYLLMRQVYVYLLSKFIQQYIRANCDGCKVVSGAQDQHMGPAGCLNESFDHTREYYVRAKNRCTPVLMVSAFEKFRRHIGAAPLDGQVIAEAAVNYLGVDTCMTLMATPNDRSYVNVNMLLDAIELIDEK